MIVTPLVNTSHKGKPAPAGIPLDADDKWAKAMIKDGLVKQGKPSEYDINDVDIDLDEKTVKQLNEIAAQLDIDVPKNAKKADIIDLIATATKGGDKE